MVRSFNLPGFRLIGVQTQQTTVRVTAGGGLAVTPAGLRNLLPLSGQLPADAELTFTSKQPNYGGTFSLRPATASASVRILTVLEVEKQQVKFTTSIDYQIKRGELRTLQVRLRDWEGEDVKIEAEHVLQQRERRRSPDDRTWTLELRPSFNEPFRTTWGLAAGPGGSPVASRRGD